MTLLRHFRAYGATLAGYTVGPVSYTHLDVVGHVIEANGEEAEIALRAAANAAPIWQSTPVAERAQCLLSLIHI